MQRRTILKLLAASGLAAFAPQILAETPIAELPLEKVQNMDMELALANDQGELLEIGRQPVSLKQGRFQSMVFRPDATVIVTHALLFTPMRPKPFRLDFGYSVATQVPAGGTMTLDYQMDIH